MPPKAPPKKKRETRYNGAGRRERNKLDKLRRIKNAAKKLFVLRSFDEVTMREISDKADVAIGTIFLYAANKRDLLFLAMNDDLEEISRRAAESIRSDRPILENLLTAYRLLYEFFSDQPILSRLVLREMFFYEAGAQAKRFQNTHEHMVELTIRCVHYALDRNEIRTTEEPNYVGLMIFSIYRVEIRRWLAAEKMDIEKGLAMLKRALGLLMKGLQPGSFAVS